MATFEPRFPGRRGFLRGSFAAAALSLAGGTAGLVKPLPAGAKSPSQPDGALKALLGGNRRYGQLDVVAAYYDLASGSVTVLE